MTWSSKGLVWRRRCLGCLFLLGGIALAGRLVELQVLDYPALAAIARRQVEDRIEIPGPRGDIFDRHGRPLALSVPVKVLCAEPKEMNPAQLRLLDEAAGTPGRLANKPHARWVVVRRDCEDEVVARIDRLVQERLIPKEAIWWGPGYRRQYPNDNAAAQVLGFVTLDGKNAEGVEKSHDTVLRSASSFVALAMDGHREAVEQIAGDPGPASPAGLMLSLDLRIQEVLESALEQAVEEHDALGARGIVLDPKNGEILAMAALPSFNPNRFWEEDPATFRNPAVELPFEPGSVMKPFTATALVEAKRVQGFESVYCEGGRWTTGSRTIFDIGHHGSLTLPEVLTVSSNIGIVKFSRRMSGEIFRRTLAALGFGHKTGVDLPAENPGRLLPQGQWRDVDRDSVAFGYAISATPLQLATAFAAIANGGLRVHPHIGRGTLDRNTWTLFPVPPPEQAISASTSATVRGWLQRVVADQRGTGRRAAVPGYFVGGKTGSAEKLVHGRYDKGRNMASFAGFAPLTDPRVLVIITIDEPKVGGRTGGITAAPAFSVVMGETLRLLRLPPDCPDDPLLLKAKNLDPEAETQAANEAAAAEGSPNHAPDLPSLPPVAVNHPRGANL